MAGWTFQGPDIAGLNHIYSGQLRDEVADLRKWLLRVFPGPPRWGIRLEHRLKNPHIQKPTPFQFLLEPVLVSIRGDPLLIANWKNELKVSPYLRDLPVYHWEGNILKVGYHSENQYKLH